MHGKKVLIIYLQPFLFKFRIVLKFEFFFFETNRILTNNDNFNT